MDVKSINVNTLEGSVGKLYTLHSEIIMEGLIWAQQLIFAPGLRSTHEPLGIARVRKVITKCLCLPRDTQYARICVLDFKFCLRLRASPGILFKLRLKMM